MSCLNNFAVRKNVLTRTGLLVLLHVYFKSCTSRKLFLFVFYLKHKYTKNCTTFIKNLKTFLHTTSNLEEAAEPFEPIVMIFK